MTFRYRIHFFSPGEPAVRLPRRFYLGNRMKTVWIAILVLCLAAPVRGQSADAESSGKTSSRRAKVESKAVPAKKAESGGKASASSTDTGKRKRAGKPFVDENGDGLNDVPSPGTKRSTRASEKTNGRSVDRFTDPDGDGINDGRGFERSRSERGRSALERNIKEKNNLREKNKK